MLRCGVQYDTVCACLISTSIVYASMMNWMLVKTSTEVSINVKAIRSSLARYGTVRPLCHSTRVGRMFEDKSLSMALHEVLFQLDSLVRHDYRNFLLKKSVGSFKL